jgi:hypothetical protein
MVKLIPPVNFCSDENIQTIFGTKLEDFLNYRSLVRKKAQNLSFTKFGAFVFGKLHSPLSSARVIFVAKATHFLKMTNIVGKFTI